MEEVEEEIKRTKEEGSKNLNLEGGDMKAASENASIKCCRIDSNFVGRICWSNLELDSLLEPQEEAKEDANNKTESKLADKDALIDTLKKDLNTLKSSRGEAQKLLVESEKLVEHLNGEIKRQKDFERRLYDSFVTQTSQLEQAHIFIDKWKQKIGSMREGTEITSYEENYWLRLQVERLEKELGIHKNGQNPWEEVKRLRKELELAIEAEENNKRAMDDLALVIKEVAAEANQAKENLQIMKEETETLRPMINIKEKAHELALTEAKSVEEKSRVALGEANKENESLEATIERLRLELKEGLPSLNGKETGFVDSIKMAAMEKVNMQEENNRLLESLNEEKDESRNIRDILKQAKVEIARLKDSLVKKDKAFVALTRETERLKRKESTTEMRSNSKKDLKAEEEKKKKKKKNESCSKRGDLKGTFCSIPLHVPGLSSKIKEVEDAHETDDGLTGSIFDIVQPTSIKLHRTRSVSPTTLTDDGISVHSDDFENASRVDDIEIEKESHAKKKVLRKKFSELWRRKSYSLSHSNSYHSQSHNHNQDNKEVGIE